MPSRFISASVWTPPILIALVAIFGLKNPLRRSMSWYSIHGLGCMGSGILALLNFFAGRTLESLLVIGGWITGYLFVTGRGHIKPLKLWKKYTSKAQHQKRHRRLQAMDGGKSDKYEH